MKMTPILTAMAIAVSTTVGSQQALAGPSGYAPPVAAPPPVWGAGTAGIRVGGAYVSPDDDDDDLRFRRLEMFDGDGFRAELDADDEWTWQISGFWIPIEHWGLELNYIDGTDADTDLVLRDEFFIGPDIVVDDTVRFRDIGDFEANMSNLFVNWYPMDPNCLTQVYVGLGVNYTDFDGDRFRVGLFDDPDFDGDFDDVDGRLELGHSWGVAAQVGVDWVFGRDSNWLANAALMYIDSDTDLTFRFIDRTTGGTIDRVRADYDYNPWVFNLGLGYKFSM